MSVKIHYGPHGSFKTAGSVHDDLIPAIKEGRPIVTNIRGITLDRIYDAIPDAPADLELYHVDTSTQAGLDKAARFFHWVPPNTFMLWDEAQLIFPKRWRDSDLKLLDYPGGVDKAKEDDRAPDWWHAWDMERHHNYDIVLTSPSIKKIRDDIRENAEGAFKHKNKGLLGWIFKGSYIEGFHMADDNGTSQSDFITIVDKRIKSNDITWQLYDSTKTGQHRDTTAGVNLLASPRVLLPLGVIAIAASLALSNGRPAVLGGETTPKPVQAPLANPSIPDSPSARTVRVAHTDGLVDRQNDLDVPRAKAHPFDGSQFRLVGLIESKKGKQAFFEVDGVFMSSNELRDIGYTFTYLTGCAVAVHHGASHLLATCTALPSDQETHYVRREVIESSERPEPSHSTLALAPVPVLSESNPDYLPMPSSR